MLNLSIKYSFVVSSWIWDAGLYTCNVSYAGDVNHNSANKSFVFTVLKKNITADVVMSVDPDSIAVGDNTTFTISLPTGVNGMVNVTVDGALWLISF